MFLQRCYEPEITASGEMLRQLGEYLYAGGWEVHVVCASSNLPAARDRSPGLQIHRTAPIPYWRGNTVARFVSMARISRAILSLARRCPRPDIVISLTDPPGMVLIGDKVARHHRSPHVHWSQDVYPEIAERLGVVSSANPFIRHLKRAGTSAMQRAARVVSIGSCMTKLLITRGVPADKIATIPNWADPDLTAETVPPSQLQSLRDRLRLPAENIILYSGNFGLAHEFSTVIDCADLLQREHIPWNFVFAGGGARRADVESTVRARTISQIQFLDRLSPPDYAMLLKLADLHLVTADSRVNGCVVPSKAYAAFAARRPILSIGPAESEIDELLKRIPAGLSCRNGNYKGLATVLINLLRQPGQLEEMAGHAALAARESSLEKQGARFDAVLKSVCDSR